MNERFRFEEKIIEEALSRIKTGRVRRSKKYKQYEVGNYLVVYSPASDAFVGIGASRFLDRNYASAVVIDDPYCIRANVRRQSKSLLHVRDDRVHNYEGDASLYGFDLFLKKYPDCGYEILKEHIRDSASNRVGYALLYLRYPLVRQLIDKGYYGLVEAAISDYDPQKDFGLLSIPVKEWKIPKGMIALLMENGCTYQTYEDVYELFSMQGLDRKRLKWLIDNEIETNRLCALLKDHPDVYSLDSLIEYAKRCIIYQDIKGNRIMGDLYDMIDMAEKIDMPYESYPADLRKDNGRMFQIANAFRMALRRSEQRKTRYEDLLESKAYDYEDGAYLIRRECDEEHLLRIGPLFMNYLPDVTDFLDYFWLCDSASGKELVLLRWRKNRFLSSAYNDRRPRKKERSFISAYTAYKQRVDLALA